MNFLNTYSYLSNDVDILLKSTLKLSKIYKLGTVSYYLQYKLQFNEGAHIPDLYILGTKTLEEVKLIQKYHLKLLNTELRNYLDRF